MSPFHVADQKKLPKMLPVEELLCNFAALKNERGLFNLI
jgi:hypothetical protein